MYEQQTNKQTNKQKQQLHYIYLYIISNQRQINRVEHGEIMGHPVRSERAMHIKIIVF
jgi:hypothetical protein